MTTVPRTGPMKDDGEQTGRERAEMQIALAKAEERIVELERQRARLISTVSHDIRAPLGVILGGLSELTAAGMPELSEEQTMLVRLIRRSAHRLMEFSSDLVDVARAEEGKLALARREVNLSDVIGEVVDQNPGGQRPDGRHRDVPTAATAARLGRPGAPWAGRPAADRPRRALRPSTGARHGGAHGHRGPSRGARRRRGAAARVARACVRPVPVGGPGQPGRPAFGSGAGPRGSPRGAGLGREPPCPRREPGGQPIRPRATARAARRAVHVNGVAHACRR